MSLLPYIKYKPSGAEWIGAVPIHWNVRRLGYFFEERRETVSDVDFEPLSVTKQGIVPQLEIAAKTDDNDNRKKVCRGDFVINSRSDRNGSSGLADRPGSVSLINIVLQPRPEIEGGFAHHLFRSEVFQEEFYRWGKGIVADLWTTRYSEMREILLAVPPLNEQLQITKFLDRETAKIDALVAEQEKLIGLLKEKRQAVITHAVTKGLDRNMPMKNSVVEWLGEVPEPWQVKRFKYVVPHIEQGWSPEAIDRLADGEEWGVLKAGCVNHGEFRETEHKTLPPAIEPPQELRILPGDVLMSRASGSVQLIGSVAQVHSCSYNLILSDKIFRLQIDDSVCLKSFLVFAMSSIHLRTQIVLAVSGAEGLANNIGKGAIREFLLTLPPLKEQEEINVHLDSEMKKIDSLVAESRRAIDLLKEHRSALISAAVTGKIDVRGLADTKASEPARRRA